MGSMQLLFGDEVELLFGEDGSGARVELVEGLFGDEQRARRAGGGSLW